MVDGRNERDVLLAILLFSEPGCRESAYERPCDGLVVCSDMG